MMAILLLYNQQIIVQLLMISGLGSVVLPKKKKKYTLKRKRNNHRDHKTVIEFIHLWSNSIFQQQFRLSREDFYTVQQAMMNYKTSHCGYDEENHFKFATLSSGSPVTLELRLFITLRILSGASYLDMIWYAVDVNTVPSIFWATICDIDGALDNINFPSDADGMAQLVGNWAKKRENNHGFATNIGTVLSVDGFVIEIIKPNTAVLNGQEVTAYKKKRKGFGGLISQVGCDSNAKVRFVQTNWPGATNDLTCFRSTMLYNLLCSRSLPDFRHIVGDEAYSPLAAECNNQIMTPFSQHQLNSARKLDSNNLKEWEARMQLPNAPCSASKPEPIYWKMRVFNHEFSSEHITVKRCLGMMVCHFGILWRAMKFSLEKVTTIFCVICKLHNVCMDQWQMNHHTFASLGRFSDFSDVEAPPFSDNGYLWESFDITVGLDDAGDQPTDEVVLGQLTNQCNRLNDQRC